MAEELDIRPLMIELHNQGCQLALPVVVAKSSRWCSAPGGRAIRSRRACSARCIRRPSARSSEPDALIVPLLAVDEEGWRLGYGGGFYDRTLEALRARKTVTAMGVGFNAQLVPEVPHGPSDQRLDWLLTDKRACAFV